MKRLATFLLLMFSGCLRPHEPPKPPADDWRAVCTIRHLRVTQNGESAWTREAIQQLEQYNLEVYRPVRLDYKYRMWIDVEDPELFSIDNLAEWYALCLHAQTRYYEHGEIAVHLVDAITWMNAIGIANYPSNAIGFCHGIALAIHPHTRDEVLAHELGHAWNLAHSFDDGWPETDSPPNCNIMSYEFYCRPHVLSSFQINEIQNWALSPERIRAVELLAKDRLAGKRAWVRTGRKLPVKMSETAAAGR